MTYSNAALARHFYSGGRKGKANSMEIEGRSNGESVLWGYGWAVYALRSPGGTVYKFTDWNGYSHTTSCHMSLISGANVVEIDEAPESITEAHEAVTDAEKKIIV